MDLSRDLARGTSPHDRLAALRHPVTPMKSAVIPRPSLVFAACAVLVVVVVAAIFLMGGRGEPAAPLAAVDPLPTPTTAVLLEGEVLVSVAAEAGSFPPALSVGDGVRVVVSPFFGTESVTRALPGLAIVHAVGEPGEFSGTHVVTLRGPESMAVDIADAERVRLAIVSKAAP